MTTGGKTVVLRYQNRKLYNTVESKYTTLGEMLKLGIGGFTVVDHKTKTDITNETVLNAVFTYLQNNPEKIELVKAQLGTTLGLF